ncbi:MAG: hypothetical protein LBP50_03245 [Tannerella sp.]|jgi:hypothetical protein|nr:hypothetical protein [Tannerella sp.]
MALKTIVDIAKIMYGDVITSVTAPAAGLTGAEVAALIALASTKNVVNVHGDTWSYEEEEGSTTPFRNQLSGATYYNDLQPGAVNITFTIGQYEYQTRADLQGGTATSASWARPAESKIIYKSIIAVTKDDTYIVIPKAQVSARGSMVESKLIGLAVTVTPVETGVTGLAPEYFFDASEIVAA